MPGSFTLGKKERLKSRKSIELLFREGKGFTIAPFRVYYAKHNAGELALQFGAGVSSRHFKKAADRNRVKRLLREAWRLQKTALQQKLAEQNSGLNVFCIYTARELPVYQQVYDSMSRVLDKLLAINTPVK